MAHASSGAPMRIFPAWMYRDPADAAARIEATEINAELRARIRQIERVQEIEQLQRALYQRMGVGLKRVALAPPDVRMKRARIQALTRKAMKERA
jgi:hypothetical protein